MFVQMLVTTYKTGQCHSSENYNPNIINLTTNCRSSVTKISDRIESENINNIPVSHYGLAFL
jgi:hypothetical protein